jgi:hypothetical protein
MIPFQNQLGLVYFFSFSSYYVQWPGLYGSNGLLPVQDYIKAIENTYLSESPMDVFMKIPSLTLLYRYLGVTPDAAAEFLVFAGTVLSLCCATGLVLSYRGTFALLWLFYLSIFNVGQTFASFQWDILLLEIGFLSIIAGSKSPYLSHLDWCYRFLAFKLMFLSGVVKLQAHCPVWESLTALEFHFATQCIPTPLAWFAHQMPPFLLRLGVAVTLLIEIPLAIMLVAPLRSFRRVGVSYQVLLQILILLTGNYNFFNLLTLVLMGKVWVDDWPPVDDEPKTLREIAQFAQDSFLGKLAQYMAAMIFSLLCWTKFFTLKLDLSNGFISILSNSKVVLVTNLSAIQNEVQYFCFASYGKPNYTYHSMLFIVRYYNFLCSFVVLFSIDRSISARIHAR